MKAEHHYKLVVMALFFYFHLAHLQIQLQKHLVPPGFFQLRKNLHTIFQKPETSPPFLLVMKVKSLSGCMEPKDQQL